MKHSDVGGRHFAENEVLKFLNALTFANPNIIATTTGLPTPLTLGLLCNLEDKGYVKQIITDRWAINDKAN